MRLWTHQTALDWILNHLTRRLAQLVQLRFHLSPYAQYSLSQRSTMEFRNTRFDYLRITNCIVVLHRTRSGWFFMSSDGCRHGFQVPKNPNRLNGDPTIYVKWTIYISRQTHPTSCGQVRVWPKQLRVDFFAAQTFYHIKTGPDGPDGPLSKIMPQDRCSIHRQ